MNAQIKELAEQAGIGHVKHIGHGEWDLFLSPAEKKFAHLIVQECANLLVKEAKSSHDEGSETYDTLIRESNWMKRYFGLTE